MWRRDAGGAGRPLCRADRPARGGHLPAGRRALVRARALAADPVIERADAVAALGEGWIAEEALAIAVYCALTARTFEDGVILAVNHDGDSDSTGAIAGNLLGAMLGVQAIPRPWLDGLELRATIEALADDLLAFPDWRVDDAGPDAAVLTRYPPS